MCDVELRIILLTYSAPYMCSRGKEEKELVVSLEQSIGHIGKCLGRDIQR